MGIGDILKNVASGATGGFLGGVSDILKDIVADPTKKAEIMQKIEELHTSIQLKQIDQSIAQINADSDALKTVNDTMQAEDKSEHFIVYSWRPFIGYTFAVLILNNYVFYPYFHNYGIVMLDIPYYVWITISSVLGVAVIGRSIEKIQALKQI